MGEEKLLGKDVIHPIADEKSWLFIGEELENLFLQLKSEGKAGIYFERGFHAFQWLQKTQQAEKLNPSVSSRLPEAILCGYRYLDGNAITFIQQLQINRKFREIPFILISDEDISHSKVDVLRYGIDDWFLLSDSQSNILNRLDFLITYKHRYIQLKTTQAQFDYELPRYKRIFDLVVSSLALVVFAPVLGFIALLIKLESHGPVLQVTRKVGRAYRIFNFYKFRTTQVSSPQPNFEKVIPQKENLPQTGTIRQCLSCALYERPCVFPLEDGKQVLCGKNQHSLKKGTIPAQREKITRLGKWLRRTSLDEIPQLIHVFRGEMSIVGNRPLAIDEAEELTQDEWAGRFAAPAGITGLWQVKSRFNGELNGLSRKEIDRAYAQKASLWMDIKILIMTIPALFKRTDY